MIFCTYFYDMKYIFFRNRLINMSKQIFSILVLIELFCNSRYCSKLRIQQKYTFPLVPENDTSRTKNSTEKVIMCDNFSNSNDIQRRIPCHSIINRSCFIRVHSLFQWWRKSIDWKYFKVTMNFSVSTIWRITKLFCDINIYLYCAHSFSWKTFLV